MRISLTLRAFIYIANLCVLSFTQTSCLLLLTGRRPWKRRHGVGEQYVKRLSAINYPNANIRIASRRTSAGDAGGGGYRPFLLHATNYLIGRIWPWPQILPRVTFALRNLNSWCWNYIDVWYTRNRRISYLNRLPRAICAHRESRNEPATPVNWIFYIPVFALATNCTKRKDDTFKQYVLLTLRVSIRWQMVRGDRQVFAGNYGLMYFARDRTVSLCS